VLVVMGHLELHAVGRLWRIFTCMHFGCLLWWIFLACMLVWCLLWYWWKTVTLNPKPGFIAFQE
jgi:hypothetical protein